MAKLFNRAKMTTATTGSGTVTLGSASNGFQTFAAAGVSNGDVVQYVIEENSNFEIGVGTYSSTGSSLTRSPTESSNSNNAITLAGQATVSITAVADDLNRLQHGGSDKVTVSSTGASVTGNLAVSGTVDGRDVASDGNKLDGIESGATADQTAAQIRAKVEAATDSNVFTDADHSKLNAIEAGATGDQTNAEIRAAVEAATDSNVFTDADHTKLNGIEASATADQTITAGGGLTGGGTGDVTISHSDTSSQASINGSGRTYIQDITLDTYGHVTGLATASETVVNTNTIPNNATITLSAGNALTGGGNFTTDQSSNETITFNHSDTSSQSSVNNSGRTYIQDITLDGYGHVTGINSASETVTNTNTNQLTTFVVEDGDGTEVTISQGKEWKFVEGGGIDINWTDTSTGSDGDPFDLTISHVDTSSQASVNNSSGTVIQDVTLDGYGHVTGLASVNLDGRYYTESEADGRFLRSNADDSYAGNLTVNSVTFKSNSNVTRNLKIQPSGSDTSVGLSMYTPSGSHSIQLYGDATNYGFLDANWAGWDIQKTKNGAFKVDEGNGLQRVFNDGYHPNADAWTTSRTLSLTGDVTGSVSWDGSANASLSTTVANDSHTHVFGNITSTSLSSSSDLNNYNTRALAHWGSSNPSNSPSTYGAMFVIPDGSQPQQLVQTYGGAANKVSLYGRRKTSGTWDTSWTQYFSDHYHPNADTLTTARTINGVSFNGSANITVADSTKLPLSGGTMTGDLTINEDGDSINLRSTTNAASVGISFSDQVTTGTQQIGHIRFNHSDTVSYGSGALLKLGSSESTTTILADGKLMYDEGIYAKPASGTGAGTRKDANWDTAYGWGDHAAAGYTSNVGDITNVSAGSGLSGGGSSGSVTLSHSDTSSQASVNNSGRTYIQDITLDTYGHITGITSATETVVNTDTNTTYSAGTNLSLSGTTFNVSASPSFTNVYVANQILHTGDTDTYLQFHAADEFRVVTGGTERFEVTNDNITCSAHLQMSGHVLDMNNNDIYGVDQIFHEGDTNTYMQFHAADQWRVVVGGSERLEVKNSSPHVLVSGDLNSTSDERLKKNIKPIDNALADICQLEGVTFDWKDTGTQGQGFIAQQVEPIIPDVVNTDEDTGMKSINYVGLIGHLVEAIKTQQTQIDDLKAEIQSIKS